MSDPKPVFDYFRNMLICGFFVHYGIYIFNRDTWPVHGYIGPAIAIVGLVLYIVNGLWGWTNLVTSLKLKEKTTIKLSLAIVYIATLITFLDAVVHFHHLGFI